MYCFPVQIRRLRHVVNTPEMAVDTKSAGLRIVYGTIPAPCDEMQCAGSLMLDQHNLRIYR